MAGSSSAAARTVRDIFHSMEYGPPSASTAAAQAWLDHHSRALGMFIEGKLVRPADRQTRPLTDSKGGTVCSVVCAVDEDIAQCVSSAVGGFEAWSGLSCYQRAKLLLRFVSVVGQHAQCVSELDVLCCTAGSSSSLVRLVQYFTSWAQLRDTLLPDWIPLGVVTVVASDDCSLYSLMLKVLPALAMGNSVVVVPGLSIAPPALLLAQLFMEAGLPVGALNVLTGSDASVIAKVIQSPAVSYVTYSGNKQDGVTLCKATAGMGVPVSLSVSIGSICPFIIFESADIDSAVDEVIDAAFKKKKEIQWVLFVQECVWDRVLSRLKIRMEGLKCMALPSGGDRALVDAAVQEAQQQGATLIQPCLAPANVDQYPPTVLCGVAASCPCVVTPPPGPLLPLMSFRTHTEGITLANHRPHGQAASIWTEDLTLALEAAKSLLVGSVWVNSHSFSDPALPASGHKDSGSCTDGGQECLYQYLRPSSSSSLSRSSPVCLDYATFGTSASPAVIPVGSDPASTPKVYQQFVGGKPCKAESGSSVAVQAPGGNGVLAYCPDGGRKDVRNAVEAAIKVQPGWMTESPSARAQSLYSLAKVLEAKRRDMAASIKAQTGRSLEEAEQEVELSVARLSDWAARCDKAHGGALPVPQSGSAISIPEALGVVGVVLPDGKPLLSMVTVLGATIAMGNAVVMVPSQKYPLPALAFVQVLQSSDLPGGLVSIITGRRDQMTAALANHSVIKAIWYWGSTEGCQYLQYTCTSPLKTLWLHSSDDEEEEGGGEDGGMVWTHPHPSLLEEMWRNAVQWKSVWIPTA
ncbi:aldehyde dehydrogenase family 16 member A1 [Lampris incognitus]|uniref:aldehyde dehydrogenase family 16 member A1 n=1 Tax=Lampris incognitus TaxID=2546036 RepID=UPI0024B54217|nr:aldehyde dehydrogenase family 16 member A1 [Lampris incognitus]